MRRIKVDELLLILPPNQLEDGCGSVCFVGKKKKRERREKGKGRAKNEGEPERIGEIGNRKK